LGQAREFGVWQDDVVLLLLLLMGFKRHCLQEGRDRLLLELPAELACNWTFQQRAAFN
jgi:hypothetical protein